MIDLSASASTHRIDRRVYGQFAEHLGRCIYEGVWVGADSGIPNKNGIRTDVVDALRHIKVPLVRWPGGCFADEYHWLKGVGDERQPMVNTHWGGVVESNEFGTHEYFELLDQLDAEAYINGNVGSGTVAEMQDWVEYMTLDHTAPMAELRKRHGREQPFKLEFFGVGNESWGCGGNMLPLHYANQYRQFQTYVRNYGDNRISKIACGANSDDYEWTEVLMARAAGHMDGLSLHYYTLPTGDWDAKGSATDFDEHGWYETIRQTRRMDELLTRHSAIMDTYDPAKRVSLIVDEWGTWYDVEQGTNPGFLYQQSTMRDALVAALNLNIFHRHGARVRMANIAQMVNVLQAMLLTDGSRMVKTPTYHVFDLYSDHQDADFVGLPGGGAGAFDSHGDVTVSRKDGALTISTANWHLERGIDAAFDLPANVTEVLRAEVLTSAAPTVHNTFDAPDAVRPVELPVRIDGRTLRFELPPRSVATVRVGQR
ncbi:alpha-N-arabinofuranosidase [Microbacterium terrae]|uniref:non-reducing end alpha-L-arabinofuranosidase n=1 Tax=Microbacterium terrae TaxID=69369 RepID=A0A0M2HGA3_9MICO|nr:alpha-L-arabinofuranosidase C-terminal domain-containing protein [Microbacterium terrae]KJL43324.1 Intracellular exo-alpha-L-arabinofuranosidase 2 [Microbacterium terrae]MBP1078471.1 alpha-N-arabinofuranosidase [Microbacterium terrae]GLJ97872.1 intracellular exo-alpha-L-arabinofuranosidase 2 [Microbacterium terrae]